MLRCRCGRKFRDISDLVEEGLMAPPDVEFHCPSCGRPRGRFKEID